MNRILRQLGEPTSPQDRLWLYRLAFPLVRAVTLGLYKIRYTGGEHVPRTGPYITVANHTCWKDPPVIELALNRAIRFMGNIETFDVLILGALIRGIGCFPVRRGQVDRGALLTCLRVLDAGQPLGVFPEGRRSREGPMRRARPGIGLLARRSGAPIVPIGLTGTRESRLAFPPRQDVWVRVGASFRVGDLGLPPSASNQTVADAIMARVAELLPPEMRGFYAAAAPR